jgi:hypothetical protein
VAASFGQDMLGNDAEMHNQSMEVVCEIKPFKDKLPLIKLPN